MSDLGRFKMTDGHLFESIGQSILVGEAFAFVGKEHGQIIPLFGSVPIDLPGVSVKPTNLASFNLASITSDKRIYRRSRDVVHLLVLKLTSPDSSQSVTVELNGKEFTVYIVTLGRHGEGTVLLRDLPVGEFKAFFTDETQDIDRQGGTQSDAKNACIFQIAEYRLVPLVAALVDCKMNTVNQLSVRLNIESFGTPVEGDVKIEVVEGVTRRALCVARAVHGRLESIVQIEGNGPHELSLQLVAEPNKTATVPLPGSRLSERTQTLFSPLGTEIQGSLMPTSDARAVRGIYLSEGGERMSPIVLERVDTAVVRLKACVEISDLTIVAIDTTAPAPSANAVDPSKVPHPGLNDPTYCSSGRRELKFQAIKVNQIIEFDAYSPATVLALGAYIDGKAWEGSACVITPAKISPKVYLQEVYKPGEQLSIEIEPGTSDPAAIYVVVKDARLLSIDNPETRLAARLKNGAESLSKKLPVHFLDANHSLSSSQPILWDWDMKGRAMEGGIILVCDAGSDKRREIEDLIASQGRSMPLLRSVSSSVAPFAIAALHPKLVWIELNPDPVEGLSLLERLRKAFPDIWFFVSYDVPHPELIRRAYQLGASDFLDPEHWHRDFPAALQSIGPKYQSESVSMSAGQDFSGHLGTEQTGSQMQNFSNPPVATTANTAAKPEPIMEPKVANEPEVLFAGFARAENGKATVKMTLPDVCTNYLIECFVISGCEWSYSEHRFLADKDPGIDLVVPVFSRFGEPVLGTLNIKTKSLDARIKILCNGKEVELYHKSQILPTGQLLSANVSSLQFLATPGEYEAIVETEHATSKVTKRVSEPGKLKYRVHSLRLLQPGESLGLADDASYVTLKVLPGLDTKFELLTDATADYGQSCCEQTAAKIVSGCAMYMFSGADENRRNKAEAVILAGIRRERSMWLPGKGFKAYPDSAPVPNPHYGGQAARYLWNLDLIRSGGGKGLSNDLRQAIDEAMEMAKDASRAYGLQYPPINIMNCQDAYAALRFAEPGTVRNDAVEFVKLKLAGRGANEFEKSLPHNPFTGQRVNARCETSYAAAALLRHGAYADKRMAVELANQVVKCFNEQGRLYSTIDSVAAIALMSELLSAKIAGDSGSVEINGVLHCLKDALDSRSPVQFVKAVDGVAVVEIGREVEEDWNAFSPGMQLRVALEKDGKAQRTFSTGDALDLRVTIEQGYTDGDLLWICLPDSLSRIVGGGQVKQFCVDFAGNSELVVPLAATAPSVDQNGNPYKQGVCVCVRNMFEEERSGCPGLFEVSVTPSTVSS